MRDDDMSDPWGTAMAWQFAVCENLAAAYISARAASTLAS